MIFSSEKYALCCVAIIYLIWPLSVYPTVTSFGSSFQYNISILRVKKFFFLLWLPLHIVIAIKRRDEIKRFLRLRKHRMMRYHSITFNMRNEHPFIIDIVKIKQTILEDALEIPVGH